MKVYTLGFVFSPELHDVLLIRKNRPAWQAGRLNGLGGKLEVGETLAEGMARELREESGLVISAADWTQVGSMRGKDWEVVVFTAIYTGEPSDAAAGTDEEIRWVPIREIPQNVIPNLHWLIPMCRDKLQTDDPDALMALASIEYRQ